MEAVLPLTGTYQIKALVSGVSLDDCSLIDARDVIRPYIANSANDPDITGLMVFLQDSRENVLGGKVLYTLKPEANANFETDSGTAPESVQTGTGQEKTASETGGATAAANPASEKPAAAETSKKTGGKNILFPVRRLDKDLPGFPMPENLAMGQYTLVFQIMGAKETLQQTEKAIYYLDNAEFSLKEIQVYLPAVSAGPRLVQPGAAIMLDARLDFDARLDPYIVWYNGRKIINEGTFAGGSGRFLWKAPDQTGFQSIRAEAFPFRVRQGIAGSSREISIPVSAKTAATDLVSGDAPALLHWYQFEGNLQDSKFPMSSEKALIPQGEKAPQWSPAADTYGLSAGADAVYQLPPVSFKGADAAGGQFLLRFKPVSDGNIFSALFASRESSAKAVEMNLTLKGEQLVLSLANPGKPAKEIPASIASVSGAYITAAIDFVIQPNRFQVTFDPAYSGNAEHPQFHDANTDQSSKTMSLSFAAILSGECALKLGAPGSAEKEKTGGDAQNQQAESAYRQRTPLPEGTTAIWDEFAILSVSPPLAQDSNEVSVIAEIPSEEETNVSGL